MSLNLQQMRQSLHQHQMSEHLARQTEQCNVKVNVGVLLVTSFFRQETSPLFQSKGKASLLSTPCSQHLHKGIADPCCFSHCFTRTITSIRGQGFVLGGIRIIIIQNELSAQIYHVQLFKLLRALNFIHVDIKPCLPITLSNSTRVRCGFEEELKSSEGRSNAAFIKTNVRRLQQDFRHTSPQFFSEEFLYLVKEVCIDLNEQPTRHLDFTRQFLALS